jgi:hypothetical protein
VSINPSGDIVKKARFFFALLVASFFGGLSVLMIQFPDRIGAAAILLFPGAVLGIATSGNVHDFRTWAVALGNFVFYFGLAYLVWGIWEKHTRKTDVGKED